MKPKDDEGIILSNSEIERLTGGLTQPAAQVRELQAQGFCRARVVRGTAIVERAHYEAVCAGVHAAGLTFGAAPQLKSQLTSDETRPRVRIPPSGRLRR